MGAPSEQAVCDHALDLLNGGRADLAEPIIRRQLAHTPDHPDLHRLLSACLRGRKQMRAALAEAQEAVRLAPQSSPCLIERGDVLVELGRWRKAEHDFREALRLDPTSVFAYNELAILLIHKHSLEEAIAAAHSGLAIDPTDNDCLIALGVALHEANRREEAHDAYRMALADEPARATLHNELGLLLADRGEWSGAQAEFREALRLDPQLAIARENLDTVKGQKGTPHQLRFNLIWLHVPVYWQIIPASLAVGGIYWPVAWGLLAYPLTLDLSRAIPRGLPGGLRALIGGLGLLALIASLVVIPSFFPPPSIFARGLLPPLQVLGGVFAGWTFMPVVVAPGRARVVALIIFLLAILAALLGSLPPENGGIAPVGLIGPMICAYFASDTVFKIERPGWKPGWGKSN